MTDRPGWFAVRRAGWLWKLPPGRFRVAMEMIRQANISDTKVPIGGEVVTVPRGSLLCSRSELARACGVSEKVVRTTIRGLESDHTVVRQRAGTGARAPSLISFVNFDEYNPPSGGGGQQGAGKGPARGRQGARSGQGTSDKGQGQLSLPGEVEIDPPGPPPPPKPKRRRAHPAEQLLDAFARGAGDKFDRPPALDARTAPALNKLWKELRDGDADWTLEDVELAGRYTRSWRKKPVGVGWLLAGANLLDALVAGRKRAGSGAGGARRELVALDVSPARRAADAERGIVWSQRSDGKWIGASVGVERARTALGGDR